MDQAKIIRSPFLNYFSWERNQNDSSHSSQPPAPWGSFPPGAGRRSGDGSPIASRPPCSSRRAWRARRQQKRPDRLTITLDRLGLHRRKRETIRAIADHIEVLEHLVGFAKSVAHDTYADDEPNSLRASSTMLRAVACELMSTTAELATRLGELRFMAFIEAVTIEDGPE